jgi:hypothetical protein
MGKSWSVVLSFKRGQRGRADPAAITGNQINGMVIYRGLAGRSGGFPQERRQRPEPNSAGIEERCSFAIKK